MQIEFDPLSKGVVSHRNARVITKGEDHPMGSLLNKEGGVVIFIEPQRHFLEEEEDREREEAAKLAAKLKVQAGAGVGLGPGAGAVDSPGSVAGSSVGQRTRRTSS
jgi:hypothetical protein